jgi:TonB family protein
MRWSPWVAGFGLTLVTMIVSPGWSLAAPTQIGPRLLGAAELQLTPLVRRLPAYPPAPRRAGLDGRVRLQGTLTADGTISNLRCVDCAADRAGFAAAALEAIAGWSYEPVRTPSGVPLAVPIAFDVEFRR